MFLSFTALFVVLQTALVFLDFQAKSNFAFRIQSVSFMYLLKSQIVAS